MNKKIIFIILIVFSCVGFFSFKEPSKPTSYEVIVSIPPYKHFSQKLLPPTISTHSLVSEYQDPHSYEPSSKELLSLFKAKVWFLTGEPFEKHFEAVVLKNNPEIKIVDLKEGFSLLKESCCHQHDEEDLHLWVSPKIAKVQMNKMAEVLSELYPEHEKTIQNNQTQLELQFHQLDQRIQHLLKIKNETSFLVSHPAFAYFAHDYGLHQLSIEKDGEDPSPKYLTELFDQIEQKQIQTLFAQRQHNYKASEQVAKSKNLKLVEVNPYSEDYFNNLNQFAEELSK